MEPAAYFRGKSVLITGGSSGIGEELAWQLGQLGAQLTLMARRTERLQRLGERIAAAGAPRPLMLQGDVTHEGDVENAVALSVQRWGRLEVAMANAGFGVVGNFACLELEDYRRQFETNVFGVIRTLRAALPEVEKARGHLVIIGSVAGWVAAPGSSPYTMSKFALRALANSITPELALTGVKVTLISPGFVQSEIRRVDNQGVFQAGAPESIPAWLVVSRDKAVRQILRAVAKGRREAIITGHGKILVALERFAPWVLRSAGRSFAARGGSYRGEPKSG
jgi:short-subunit dehydrogenase